MTLRVRPLGERDAAALVAMRVALWPDGSPEDHDAETRAMIAGEPWSTMPLAVFVADADGEIVGFIEVGMRSHADGCDATRAVGYVEGWYVAPSHRARGVGRALMKAAEQFCREQGAREIASDTWIDNVGGQHAHAALGFEVVDRCVHYKKPL